MPTEMFTMVSGKTTKLMASEFTHIWMVLVTKVNGRKINNTARDLRLGMMELRIKEFTSMAKSTAKDTSSGETKVNM